LIVELEANHGRVITSRLAGLEKALDEIEGLLVTGSGNEVFNRRVDNITTVEKDTLRELISEARRELRSVAEEFSLESETENVRGRIASLLAFGWSDLEDTRPEKLRGYGKMPPEAAAFLSPRVQRLIDLVQSMTDVVSETGRE
jgi:hypothetical protein